eukprot:1776717-Prymnesium_polylepis.1
MSRVARSLARGLVGRPGPPEPSSSTSTRWRGAQSGHTPGGAGGGCDKAVRHRQRQASPRWLVDAFE